MSDPNAPQGPPFQGPPAGRAGPAAWLRPAASAGLPPAAAGHGPAPLVQEEALIIPLVLVALVLLTRLGSGNDPAPIAAGPASSQAASQEPVDEATSTEPTEEATSSELTKEPTKEPTKEATKKAEKSLTPEQENAVEAAENYLDFAPFSPQGPHPAAIVRRRRRLLQERRDHRRGLPGHRLQQAGGQGSQELPRLHVLLTQGADRAAGVRRR